MIAVFGQCGRESESGDDAGAPIDFVRAAAGTAVTGDGRAAVAGQLGVSPGEVAAMIGDLSLLKRGVFFDVDTVGLGAIGSRQLPWSLFGLDDPATEATLGVRFSPPRVMLAPDEYRLPILRAADEAHALLGRFGYRITVANLVSGAGSGFLWVPAKALARFQSALADRQGAFAAAIARLLDAFDAAGEDVAAEIRRQAHATMARLEATGRAVPETFTGDVEALIRRLLPSRDDLRAMRVVAQPAAFFLGSEIEAEIAATEQGRLARQESEHARRLRDLEQHLLEEARRAQLWADREAIRLQVEAERQRLAEERAAERAAREINLAALREAVRGRIAPILQVFDQDLAELTQLLEDLQGQIRRHGYLPGAARRRFLDYLALLRARTVWLDPAGDGAFEAALVGAEAAVREKACRRKPRKGERPADVHEANSRESAALAKRMAGALASVQALCTGDARELLVASRASALEL